MSNDRKIQRIELTCGKCKQQFEADTVVNAPIDLWIASVKTLHCPKCGADWNHLLFGHPKAPETE